MRGSRFLKNAAVLTLTSLGLRIAGMVLRIYLADAMGSEGLGLYQLVFSVYMLAATFASSGFSVAVTRLITDEKAGKKRTAHILARSIGITVGMALATMAVLWLFADTIALKWIHDERAGLSLKILSFSLPFMAVSCNIRGYFIARKKVSVPSNAQLFEQAIRIAIIVIVVPMTASKGIEYSCAAVLFADSIAEAMSCGFIWVGYLLDRRKQSIAFGTPDRRRGTVRKLLSIAAPITAGRYLTTLLRTVENLLVPTKLTEYNADRTLSVSQFGDLKGMAMPLLFFPASFLTALSTLLVPELSGAKADKNEARIGSAVQKTVRLTLLLSLFISACFSVFCEEIASAVYGESDVAFYLRWLSPLIPLMYLESVTAGMMQGLDQQGKTFTYNLIDSVCRIALIFLLLPHFGMTGFMLVMVVSNLLTSLLNLRRLLRVSHVKVKWFEWVIKPALLSLFSVLAARFVLSGVMASALIHLCLYLLVSALVFFALTWLFSKDLITETITRRR